MTVRDFRLDAVLLESLLCTWKCHERGRTGPELNPDFVGLDIRILHWMSSAGQVNYERSSRQGHEGFLLETGPFLCNGIQSLGKQGRTSSNVTEFLFVAILTPSVSKLRSEAGIGCSHSNLGGKYQTGCNKVAMQRNTKVS